MGQRFPEGVPNYYTWTSGFGVTSWPFSMFARVCPLNTSNNGVVLSIGDKDNLQTWSALFIHGVVDDTLQVDCGLYSSVSGADPSVSSNTFSANRWYSIGGNFRSTGIDGYFDYDQNTDISEKVTVSFDSLGSSTGHDQVRVGYLSNLTPTNKLEGDVAEAAIWKVELTDAEHARLASGVSALLVRPEELVFYSRLIEDGTELIEGTAGTVTGTITDVEHPAVTDEPQGMSFDASLEQHGFIGRPSELDFTDDLTVECRFMLHSAPSGTDGHVLVERSFYDGTWDASFQLHIYDNAGSDAVRFRVDTGTGNLSNTVGGVYTASSDFVLNQWYTIRASYDASARVARLFIDGVYVAFTVSETTGSGTARHLGVGDLLLGRRGVSTGPGAIDGRIQYVIIANCYTAAHDLTNYPLDEPPTATDYDLTTVLGYWQADEDNPGRMVDAVNGNNAMLLPPPAADFEAGDTEYALVGDVAGLRITGDIAIGAWVKFESLPTNIVHYAVLSKWGPIGGRAYYLSFWNNSGTYKIRINAETGTGDDSNYVRVEANFTPTLGRWYHLFATIDTSARDGKIFIDGAEKTRVLDNAGSGTTINAGTIDLGIGAQPNGANYYDGKLAHVRLYDAYITDEADVLAEMVAVLSEHANLVEEWPLAEDFSGTNGNDGTETSGTIPFVDDSPILLPGFPYYNGSADFEAGDTEFVRVPYFAASSVTDIGIGVWIKLETQPSYGKHYSLVQKWDGSGEERSFYLNYYDSSGTKKIRLKFEVGTGTDANNVLVECAAPLVVDRWYHILVTADVSARTGKLYIDGASQSVTISSSGSGTVLYAGVADLSIGAAMFFSSSSQYGNYYDGKLAHVRLYDAYITDEADVAIEMHARRSEHANLVEEWPLTYKDGTAFPATNGNDGAETFGTIPTSFEMSMRTAPWALTVIDPVIVAIIRRKMCNLIVS